jgi:nicotinamide-nucleotide amidase
MQPTVATIHEHLGNLVFGEGDDELEHAVARLLAARKQTLATAEWGSGGMIAEWLSATSLADECFLGAIVVRNAAALQPLLGIEAGASAAENQNQVVAQMSQECRLKFNADYGLAVGPLPSIHAPATEGPTLHFAVSDRAGVDVKSSPYTGHPDILKARGAKQALNLLRLRLLRAPT